jgi:hypothetical protein
VDCFIKLKSIYNIHSILVEGGAHIIQSILEQKLVNQVVITMRPCFFGGYRVMHSQLPNIVSLEDIRAISLGGDIIIYGKIYNQHNIRNINNVDDNNNYIDNTDINKNNCNKKDDINNNISCDNNDDDNMSGTTNNNIIDSNSIVDNDDINKNIELARPDVLFL